MEKETVLLLLLLKPMTKTSQLNYIAIMRHHSECPLHQFLVFTIILMKNSHERHGNEKRNCYY